MKITASILLLTAERPLSGFNGFNGFSAISQAILLRAAICPKAVKYAVMGTTPFKCSRDKRVLTLCGDI